MRTRTQNSSLTNALQIIKSFNLENTELSLREIAESQNISISTAMRLLKTIEEENFIIHNKQEHTYKLGTSVLRLTNVLLGEFDLLMEMTPYLKELVKKTGQSAHIAMLQDRDVLYLKKEDGEILLPLKSHIGRRNPFYATSSGQVIAAYLQEDQRLALLQNTRFEMFTHTTMTTMEECESRFTEIRQQGYSVSKEELHAGFMSIAAPIRNKFHEVIASVSIAGQIKTIQLNEEKHIYAVVKAAEGLTQFIQQSKMRTAYDLFNK